MENISYKAALDVSTLDFAEHMDGCDELRKYRNEFVFPTLETLPRGKIMLLWDQDNSNIKIN